MNRLFGTGVALIVAWMTTRVAPAEEEVRRRIVEVRCERPGKVFVLGNEIISGRDESPENIVVRIAGQSRTFRPLRVGDRVRDGQLVVFVDDGSSGTSLKAWRATLRTEQERLKEITEFTRGAEANLLEEERDLLIVPHKFTAGTLDSDRRRSVVAAQLDTGKTVLEALKTRELDFRNWYSHLEQRFRQVQAELELCEVRAVRGRVTKILAQPGQTVRPGDVILQIEVDAAEDGRAPTDGHVKPAD
jgi:multidrug resistance efflux pump